MREPVSGALHCSALRLGIVLLCVSAASCLAVAVMDIARESHDQTISPLTQDLRVLSAVQPYFGPALQGDAANAFNMVGLFGVLLLTLYGTALGLCGFFSYRLIVAKGQLAIRRAVGATRRQIRYQVVLEGCVVAFVGVAVGWLLALAMSHCLARAYSLPPLPATYFASAALLLLALGLLVAVFYAREAARISPTNTHGEP